LEHARGSLKTGKTPACVEYEIETDTTAQAVSFKLFTM